MSGRRILSALVLALLASIAGATDYCIDPVTGSDTASGRCADRAWATLGPSQTFPFVSGDRVLISAGRHVHPLTQWYMKPGVSWIGAGRELTTVVYNKAVSVPFVRFRTGTGGSGSPSDLRPERFTNATVLSDMTIKNEGQASVGVDVASSDGESAPLVTRVAIVGFPTGFGVTPSSPERVAASTRALLTNSIIRDASFTGMSFLSDVFYPRACTEASTARNVLVDAGVVGTGASVRTQVQDMRDAAMAVATPILTNVTIAGGGEAALLMASYYDDGTGSVREQRNAGSTAATIRGSILTGSAGHGIREHSPFNEPAVVENNSLGGNAIGDYLDEGTTLRAAGAVGTGNISGVAIFVDRAAGDLHVMPGSPTIDRIAPGSAPADDVDGHARPQGASSDMGADEWVSCAATADAGASVQAPPCTGGSSTLDASRSTVGAACTTGLAYEWWDGATLVGTSPVLPVSPAIRTTYRLRVRCADAALSACFGETTIAIDPSTPAPTANAGSGRQACAAAGEVITFDLSGAASATAPSTLVSTTWTTTLGTIAAPGSLSTQLSVTANGSLQIATVTLTALDDAGCTAQDVIAFRIDPEPSTTIGAPAHHCHAASAGTIDIPITAPVTGGTPPFTHAWTSSEGSITGGESATLSLPGSATSRIVDVRVTVTDDAGCTAEDVASIRVIPEPVADAGADGTACGEVGGTANAPLDGSGSTGEAPMTYAWSASEGVIADPSAPVTSIALSVGAAPRQVTVTLEVTDPSGNCSSVDQRIITVGPGPTARAGNDVDECAPPGTRNFPLDGSASTGVPPLAYRWTTTEGVVADPSAAMTSLQLDVGTVPLTAIVTLEVTDARGNCAATDQVVVTTGPGAVADAGPDSVECAPASGTFTVTLDGSGSTGQPPVTHRWTASEGVIADPNAAITTLRLSSTGGSRTVSVRLDVNDARMTCPGSDTRDIRVSEHASVSPGGPYAAVQGAPDTRIPLDGATATGAAPLAWTWTTDLGTFADTGTTTSALASPELVIAQQPVTQRGQACASILSADGCAAGPSCTDVTVTLVPVQPPLDPGGTLRLRKSEPDDVVLSWQEAPTDATHDAASAYDVLASGTGCGAFSRLQRVVAVPGPNQATDPILWSPPLLRFYFVRSLNDGGASLPPAPDGSGCR